MFDLDADKPLEAAAELGECRRYGCHDRAVRGCQGYCRSCLESRPKPSEPKCAIEGCARLPNGAKGFCSRHYTLQRKAAKKRLAVNEAIEEQVIGQRFARLVVTRYLGKVKRHHRVECMCKCGNLVRTTICDLKQGKQKSCGCLRREVSQRLTVKINERQKGSNHPSFKHGHAIVGHISPTWRTWVGLFTRCENPHAKSWVNYGGAGVKVCDRWKTFESFLQDMGERPKGTTLGRFLDSGNYESSNCEWQTKSQQAAEVRGKRAMLALHTHHQMLEKAA